MTEFFNPAKTIEEYIREKDIGGIHHLIRYTWATAVLRDMKPTTIIDIACGAGYGSKMIADALPQSQIIGADYDPAAVDFARTAYQAPNLRYVTGDLMRWDDLGDYDCIVSFDTLEHIPHRELALENIVAHCGYMLFSTPCGSPVNDLNPAWEHHKIEYSTQSLMAFLCRYFGTIIDPEKPAWPHKEIFHGIDYLLKCNPLVCMEPIRREIPHQF
jgi:2-polyprenyl-3-methyl-5-hydroxy-6-metoxy-1,4-benzoquinol methylase